MQPQAASQQRGRQVAKAGPVAPVNFLLLSCLYAYLSSPFFLQKDCQLRQSPALYHPSSSWVLIQPPKVYFWPTCKKAASCGSFSSSKFINFRSIYCFLPVCGSPPAKRPPPAAASLHSGHSPSFL